MIEDVNPVQLAEKWQQELKLAKREDEKWLKRGKKIVKRYRDDRQGYSDNAKRYNILWSNVQTLTPALYGKTPKAEVGRRWKDQDPVGRTAAMILERALQFELDHKPDFDHAMKCAVLDRLLPGRGTAWVRFEAAEQMETAQGPTQYECTPVDYVFFEDFRCSPARTWDEVTWVARRVYMSKADGRARFGEDFNDVPLTHEPIGLDDMVKNGENVDSLKKAQIWEIWDKTSKRVQWLAEGYSKILDVIDDPYGLDGFWPCPKPLYSTQTTDTLVPVPDFALYQDQADEIDLLTQRINMLVKAVKVVGVYDASATGVQRMLSEGVDNTLIPIDSWAAFGEKGGLKGAMDMLPLDSVLQALQQCYMSREQAKQVIYDITGISDIIRGSSVATETATAQQIKSQFATLRLKDIQKGVAVFASELLRIKGQLMADLYSPQALVEMSGIMGTQDAPYVEQAIQLIKTEPARTYRMDVASDSLVEIDENTEKQSRMEFLTAAGGFLEKAAMAPPAMMPLLGEMLLFGVRSFKSGKTMESAIETFLQKTDEEAKQPKPPQPNPEEIKAQAEMQRTQATMQLEGQKMQSAQALEQAKMQAAAQMEQFKAEQALQLEAMKQQAETERAQMKAQIDAETKLQIAQLNAQAKTDVQVQVSGEERLNEVGDQVKEMAEQATGAMGEQTAAMAQAMQMLAEAVSRMNKPKRRELLRGPDGKAQGVIEIEMGDD